MSEQPDPSEPLQVHVDWWVEKWVRVVEQTDTNAKLVKRKRPISQLWALSWFLLDAATTTPGGGTPKLATEEKLHLNIAHGKVSKH